MVSVPESFADTGCVVLTIPSGMSSREYPTGTSTFARMLLRLDDSGITHHMNEPGTTPGESA